MKKLLSVLLIMTLAFAFVACGGDEPESEPVSEKPVVEEPIVEEPTKDAIEEPVADEPVATDVEIDKSEYEVLSYDNIVLSASDFTPETIMVRGTIDHTEELDGMVGMYIAMNNDTNQMVYVLFTPDLWNVDYTSGNSIKAYGYLSGTDPNNGLPLVSPDLLEN
jgi:predicted small lipoprotein YifL